MSLNPKLKDALTQQLRTHTVREVEILSARPVSGGDINAAWQLQTSHGRFFAKSNSATRFTGMFGAEARGLELLQEGPGPLLPEVIGPGESGEDAWLLLEWMEPGPRKPDFWEQFGRELAQLHLQTHPEFGLDHDNYIGSLPQSNHRHHTWDSFFVVERLEAQLRMAIDDGQADRSLSRAFDHLFAQMENLFPKEPASLLHGDLWSGNFIVGPKGQPVLIDPAVYFGHREMDLGMTRLFGGFDAEFYRSYHAEHPLENGWEDRLNIANLYPLMVHVNLFGGGYLSQVKSILRRFH